MLILSRKLTETLCIGEDVEITVLGIHGNQVRLGVTAPRNVSVDREEIRLRKLAEKTRLLERGGDRPIIKRGGFLR